MAIAWTDLAELGKGPRLEEGRSRVCRNVEGRRACEPRLRLICLLFEPLRQLLVARRNCAHHVPGVRVGHCLGFGQDFLGARPQVANTRQKLQIRHFARPPNSHTLGDTITNLGASRPTGVIFLAGLRLNVGLVTAVRRA
jgi:hypothetical protein